MRVALDPAACDGLGMCAHQAPDLIVLDPWGYPIVDGEDLSEDQVAKARRAVRACPKRALYEVRAQG